MILVDDTLELIIVAIFIVLVSVGGFFLWERYTSANEQRNAQLFIDSVIGKYTALEYGQNNTFVFQGFKHGEAWFLLGYNRTADPSAKPAKCLFDSCLCLCKGSSISACQTDGFCRMVNASHVIVRTSSSEVVGTSSAGSGSPPSPSYGLVERQCIVLQKGVLSIAITKTSQDFILRSDSAPTSLASNGWTQSRAQSCNQASPR